ncbi:MAG: TonB-dependent receptor [Acidimicrobiia bacterium]|nr:TonB-dependent receptor [Acidimicrobiia bacterium]
MRACSRLCLLVVCVMFVPAVAYGQASIAGVVRDTSGAVLPGVTVEAASPALIEQTRSVTTDGTGLFRIVDLRPGVYAVTFTLPGFSTVRREGVTLAGSFVATLDVEMRVGELAETITVTGETPTVNVQSATRQMVMDSEVIETIPTGRSTFALGVLVPGVIAQNAGGTLVQDVGGARVDAALGLAIHGSRQSDQTILFNGVSTSAQASSGYATRTTINPVAVQEVTFDYSAVNAEVGQGGVRINMIPKDGGNTNRGVFHVNFATPAMQGDNFSDELRRAGLSAPDRLRTNRDVNPGFGGPIRQDRIWYYVSGRFQEATNYVAGVFENRNANRPDVWTYDPDTSRQGYTGFEGNSGDLRLTWQATPKNKLGFAWTYQVNCGCPQVVSATVAPEADQRAEFPEQQKLLFDWTSPLTNRLLLEAAFLQSYGVSVRSPIAGLDPRMITVVEQSNGLKYRGPDPGLRWQDNESNHIRGAVSYITGAHAFKVGFTHNHGYFFQTTYAVQPISYRFNNGVPNQLTIAAVPYNETTKTDHSMGIFAQDTWTIRRLTAGLGVRYDYYGNSQPEQRLGPTIFTPGRDITLPASSNLSWHDLTPKLTAAYDLFGNRRTAVKVSLNRYVESLAAGAGLPAAVNPLNNIVNSTTRSWNDANRNFVPDCDLRTPAANGECGAFANAAFGTVRPGSTYDPDLMRGWSKRGFNWEFAAGVQHELMPRVAVDVGYFRRWFGNFVVTDNLSVSPSDFTRFSVTAPGDSRLPGGGGYAVPDLFDVVPARFGQVNNFVTLADKYGTQSERWHGFDVTMSARPRNGLLVQGGMSAGSTLRDSCEIREKLPETAQLNPYCHTETPLLTQVKLLGAYTIPRIDLQVSGTFQSFDAPQNGIIANFVAANAQVAPSLGRPLSGGVANVTVNLIKPFSEYGSRVNQFDMRVSRMLRFGGTQTRLALDLYNALNAAPVMTENPNYAAFRRPTSIMAARFAKISMQVDF